MYIINGVEVTLIQFNRDKTNFIYDDEDKREIKIKICPYNVEKGIAFGNYSKPIGKGYYQVPSWVDIREGDQIVYNSYIKNVTSNNSTFTVLDVKDNWCFNRVENKIAYIK